MTKDISKNDYITNDYQVIGLNEFRTKKILSLFGFAVSSGWGGDFHYTGKWFTMVEFKQQRVKLRWTEFNEWSYTNQWSPWRKEWRIIKK